MATKQPNQSGFALLISLIVVGVVLSIGLSILDLSIKQVQLSTNARESEQAFHAANAGLECARYWRRAASSSMETGGGISPECFGTGPVSGTTINPSTTPAPTIDSQSDTSGDGEAFFYTYQFDWGSSDPRCTVINSLVASTSALGNGVTTTNMTTLIPGYPSGVTEKYCEPGARCSTISVQGYNRSCGTIGGYGVVQREVLLEF